MSLHSTAQTLMELNNVEDNMSAADGIPLVMYTDKPSPEVVMEMHDPDFMSNLENGDTTNPDVSSNELQEVSEPVDIQIVVDDLPGVEALDPHLEKTLEVNDDHTVGSNQTQKNDDNEAKKSKKDSRWDWEAIVPGGTDHFVAWIQERLDEIPKHSGYDTAGIERAIAYLDKLDSEISKAMRIDLDGKLDANKIEKIRSRIDEGVERLYARLDKVKTKKGKRKKKSEELQSSLIKEAQKTTNISGIVITVPLLISRIARVCINGTVSAGHDIEDMFKRQCDYYELTTREKAECMQLLADMGFPMRQDRGLPLEEDVDQTSADNFDWSAHWQA